MSDIIPPLYFAWDGECFTPKHPRAADRYYVVGAEYRLEVREERSANTHNHYFASVNEAWKNLPEDLAERFPTADHLRKWLLIKTGWRDERSVVAASRAEALRIAAFIKPMDEYAIVTVSEAVITVYTAKSQSYRAMGKAAFQKSKSDVLDEAAAMVRVSVAELGKNAGRAA